MSRRPALRIARYFRYAAEGTGWRPPWECCVSLLSATPTRRTTHQRSARAPGDRSGQIARRRTHPAWQGRQAPRGRNGSLGVGATRSVAGAPSRAPDRRGPVCDSRADGWSPVGGVGGTQAVHHAAAAAGVKRRFAPHQLRHAHAVEMAHESVPLVVIQRQLGHANLGITSVYLQGIDSSEIISTVHGRPSPTISATAGLQMTR